MGNRSLRAFKRQAEKAARKQVSLIDLEQRLVQVENNFQLHREMFAKLVLALGQKGILKVETKTQGGIIMPDETPSENPLQKEFNRSPAAWQG